LRPRLVLEGSEIIQQEMANQAPVRTGNLRASISSDISEDQSITGTHTGYGLFADQPTAPHTIYPNVAKMLRFNIGGQDIFARQVEHPGTKGSFFVLSTVAIVKPRILELAKQIFLELMGA
jgi:hypothetical protein